MATQRYLVQFTENRGIRWLLTGRVDIEFIAPSGERLDALPALIIPKIISMDPNESSVYSTSYGYVPPSGSTIRVHYVDSDTAAREDLEGINIDNGNGGNNIGKATGAVHTGAQGGHGHMGTGGGGGGFGGGFGRH